MNKNNLNAIEINTPLGPMIAISDDETLLLLEFIGRRGLDLRQKGHITPGEAPPLTSIKEELDKYFRGELIQFKTPIKLIGTPFQQEVWNQLQKIPAGETLSYKQLAQAVGNPKGCRAVAQANGANQLAIIIPCHRVINANGALGGYGGGIERKEGLLKHEALFWNR